MHYNTLQYNTLHYNTLHYTTIHYNKIHYTALQYTITILINFPKCTITKQSSSQITLSSFTLPTNDNIINLIIEKCSSPNDPLPISRTRKTIDYAFTTFKRSNQYFSGNRKYLPTTEILNYYSIYKIF